jgi:hypothetical protein
MTETDRILDLLDPSTEAMLAEHQRLADLFLHNAEMGERRTSLYLTVISAGAAVFLGVAQFGAQMSSLLWPAVGFLAGMLVIGLVTFQRLVERRIRAAEYLRAINRIHRYFVQNDPDLEPYFYWPPCDDVPSFAGTGHALTGLRDVIAVLNAIFVGILVAVTGLALWPALHRAVTIPLGLAAGVVAWLLQDKYETRCCVSAEREAVRYIRFPGGRDDDHRRDT